MAPRLAAQTRVARSAITGCVTEPFPSEVGTVIVFTQRGAPEGRCFSKKNWPLTPSG